MLKKLFAIVIIVLILCMVINNIVDASQMPKFPKATIDKNAELDYVDIIIGDKRYELIEPEIPDRETELTDKVAMYKDDVSVIFKYTSFYSVKKKQTE